jgi:tetraacyldisaccharide 4'-kinase
MNARLEPLGDRRWARGLAGLYGAIAGARNWLFDRGALRSQGAAAPVISVGGVHAGGTGKTPVTMLVTRLFLDQGLQPAILSRGYRRTGRDPVIVRPRQQASWEMVGDEPAMIHERFPATWLGIDSRRVRAARRLLEEMRASECAAGAPVFVLDDGFQHRHIDRCIDIVCLPPDPYDHALIPAGYLREPLRSLRRADMLCVIGNREDSARLATLCERLTRDFGVPAVGLYQSPGPWVHLATGAVRSAPPSGAIGLIAGIAHPERFIRMVRKMQIKPIKSCIRPDHHIFSSSDFDALSNAGCDTLITTEKDSQRIHAINCVKCPNIWYLTLELSFLSEQHQSFFSERIIRGIQQAF